MVIIEWLKSCLRHLVICFWVRFISLLASEVEPLPKVKWCEPRGEETTPKKTTEDKNDSDGNKSKEKDEYKNEHECRNEDDQEVILYPEEPKERIQVAYVEPKLLTEDEAHSVPAEEPALSTDESEDNAWEGEEPCVRASITVGNVHTSAKQSESSSYLSCHLQEAKVANTEAKLPQLKQRVGNANLEKSEDEDDDDDSPWIGLGHSTRLTRYSGVQDLLAHSEETPSVIDKRVPGNVLRREGPLLLPRSSFIRSRSLEKSQLEEIPEEDRRLSIDESTSENQSDKIWAQLVAKYAEEQPHQETAEEFQGDSTCEKVGDEKGLKENEDCKGISTHSFLSMKTASDASTDFTDENMMSEKFSAQVGQRLNMYLARLEESKEDSEVEGKDAAEEAREVEYDSLDIEMEEGSEDKILIMIEDDESNGDRSEVQNDQNKKTFEDNLGEIVEKSTHLPHLVDSGESNNGILNFSKLPDEELGVELSIENRESLRPQGISECHPSESCSGGEKRKEYQEGPLLRDSEALTSIELEKIQESQRVDENEKLSKRMELENVTSDPAIKDIDFETNTDSQSISLKNEEPESFKDKQQIIPITTSKVNEGERSDQLIRSHSSPDETICESVLPKLSEISRNIIESPTQGRNEEPQGNLLSQKQEETTVIKDSLGKEAVIATPTDEDFAQMLECVDNRTQATEVDKTNQTLQGVTETELEVKANISKANEIKVEEVLPIESTDPKEDVPIFNIKLRRKSSPVVASDEHVVEELPEVSFSVPIRRKSKGEESLRKKALENLRRKNSSETGQISFEMRQDLISEKSEKEMAEVDDTQDETTKTIEDKEDTDKGEQSKNREELKETEDQLLHRGNEKGTLIVCDEIKNNKDANEASPQVMDLLKRRTSRDLWKMECDKLLEVRNKDDAEDADVIQEADVFNTRYEEFPEDYVSIETFNPIDLTYFIDQSKEGNERDEQLDELSLKEEGHSLQQNTRDDNENLKGDKENYLTATNKIRIDVKEALDSKTIPQTGTKVNAMEIKLTDEETQIIDSEKHKEEVDFVSEVYSEQLIQNPDEVANVRNALTFSEEDLVAKILSQKSNEDYQDNTTTEEFCKISQNEILKIDEKPEKSDIFKENIVKDDVVLEKNKTVDMSLSKESEEALQSHITDSGHSEKEHLLNLIRKERDGEKRSLSEEEIPDYLDEFKDLLVPRARRKKAKKRITAITDIVDLDEPKLSSELLKFSDAEASSVRNDLYDPVINETGKEIATHEFLPNEEGSNEFQEMKEQRTYKEAQRKELEKYLSMPDALTEEEQQELEELLAREESEKAIVAASEARLDSILSEVRKRLDTSEIDDGNLEHFLNLPVALSKEEENLLTTAEKEENEPKDFETEDEYREFIRQRYLDELEEDRLRVEDEELDFGGSYYEEDDDYEYDYKEYDGDLEGLIFTKDMEAEGKGEEGASGFEDKAVGSDDLLENLGENRKEIKTKEPKAFFSLANLKLTRKSTPRGSRESIGRTASQDSSKEESTGEEFSHTSKKFFRYGSPGVKRKKKCQTNGNGSFGESPEPMDDVEFEEEKSTIGEFAKNISDDDDVSQTNIHSLSIDGVCLKQDMSMSMKTLAEECENTQDKLTAIEVRCNASKEKEDGLTSGIVESGVNLAKVSTKEVLQDLSNGQIRTFFSTNPEVAPTTKIPLSQDSKGAVDNGSNDGLEEDIKVNHSRGDEIKRDTIAHGTYVVIMETEDCILSRVEERDKNSTKTAMPSSDSNLGGSEGTFSEQSVEVLEGETASPHVDEEKKNVRLEVSDLDETIMSGRRDFGRSSVTSTPAVNGVSSLDDSLECCPTDVLSDVIVTSVASNCSPSPKQYRYDPSAQALHSELEDTTEVGESSHMFPCTSQVPLNQPSLQELIEAELTARLAPLQPDSLDTIAYPKYHEHTRITSDSGDVTLSCTSVLDPPEALEGSHFSPDSLLDVKTDIHLNASSSPPPLSHSQSSSLSHVSQTTPPNGLINHLDIYNESVPHTTRVPSVSHSMHLPSVSLATHTPSDLINEKCKGPFKQIDLEPLMDSTMVLCSTLKDSEVTSLNLPDVIEHSISSEVIENNTSCLPAFPSNLTQSERPSMNSEVSIDDKITTPSINILDYDNDDKITTPSINILDHDNIDSSYAKTDDLSESPMSSNNLKDLNQRPPMNSEVSIEAKITTPNINILDHENIDSSYAKTDDLSESPMSSNNLKDLNQRPPMNSEVSIEDKITTPSINILDHENIDSSYAKTDDLSESPMSSNNLKDLNQRPPMNSEVSIEDKITTPSINILDHENIDSSYAKTDDLSESSMFSNNLEDLNADFKLSTTLVIEEPSKDVESSSVHPELMHLVNDENDVEQDEKVKAADYVESGIDIPSCHLDLVDVTLEDKDKEIINEEIKGCEIESHIEKTAVTEDLTPDSYNQIRDSTVSQLNTKSCSENFPIKLESESKEILTNMTYFDPIADHTISPGSSQQEPDAEAELDLEKVIRAAELKWFALKQGENQNGQGNDFAKDNLDEKVTISASYDAFSVGTSEEKEVKGHMKGEHSIALSENTIVNTTKDYDLPEEYQDTKLSNTSNGPCVTISSSNGISENIIHSNCENEIDDQSLQTSIDSEITQSSPAFPKSHPKEIDTTNSNNVLPVDVLAKISETETSQLEGVDVFITSSLLQSVGTTNGGYKSETANGDVWPEKDKKSKSAALDEFEKMEKEVMLEMEKNKEGDKKDKKKKKKKKKSDVEKENQKTTQRSKEGLLEKHVGPRIRSFDPAKMKTKFSKPKEPTQVSTDCRICGKQVFQMEKIVAEKASWHKNCFRCKECNKNLTLETYQSNEGTLYCKPHFKELFRPKAVVINEDEERKDRLMRRPRMIILESQPEALPDDVVRATDKPDYGLEELQQTLNVKQRFSMFENLAKETEKPSAEPISVRRSRSLMSKAARFLDGHDDKGDVDADYDEEEMSEEEYDEEEQCEDETEYESTNSIVRSKKKKERPMSFSGMGDLKAVWEQKQRREEMSQARKEEISKFRLMLCAGKNSTLKERFESGIFEEDEEEGEERRRNSKEEIKIEGKRVASNLMKKFERGEPFILEDEEDEEDEEEEENGITRKRERSGPEKKEVEEIFKEAETAKKARNVFKQIDQHVAQEGGPILRSHSFASTINQEHRRSLDSSALGHQTTRPPPEDVEVIKSGEKKEDFQVDTTDLASRFRFFLDYEKNKEKEKEEERKVFRITPPREGIDQVLQDVALTKANMPKPCMAVNCTVCKLIRGMQGTEDLEVLGRDPNLIKCTDNYQDDVDCGNTQNILQMFKKMEMGYDDEEEEEGPRPLKRFTPPPDGREYDDESEYSDEEYSEDEEDDEQDEDENQHPEVRDELLQMTAAPPQSARKAASLRAKFERWEAEVERNNDINKEKEELEECMPSLDTAKNLRAMFEHKASEVVKPIASKPITQKINRFVGSGDKCVACNKCVYAMEKLEVHGKILHKSCFRCHKCSTKLSMGSFSFGGGDVMYCTTHYKQLFTQKGSYDAFLEEKGKWTKKIEAINDPSTKSQD